MSYLPDDARNDDRGPPDHRANSLGWVAFAAFCCILLIGGIFYASLHGIPGSVGGTSDKQQQTSHAPAPASGETTGAAAPAQPRQ